MLRFLTRDEVLHIHARMIERFGGAPGIRDMGLLESALHRPQTGYYPDLVACAAALFESLLMNSPFVDGNKRTAFFSADVFLRLNGHVLRVEARAVHEQLMSLMQSGNADLGHLDAWLREHVERLE